MSLESVRAFFAEKAPDIIGDSLADQFGNGGAGGRRPMASSLDGSRKH